MDILITGTADKRLIVYPLLYTLNFLGNTLLLTNETSYRQLLPEGAESGEIGNTYIEAATRIIPEIERCYEFLSKDFEYRIIVTFDEINIKGDKIKVIREGEKYGENNEYKYIRVGYSQPKEKENFILLNDAICRTIYQIESNSRFVPIKDSRLLKTLSLVFSPIFKKNEGFGNNEKDMRKMLLYKGGKIT